MIKRKSFLLISVFMSIMYLTILMSACNSTHPHSYSTEWTVDESAHWHKCTDVDCLKIADYAEHTFTSIISEPTFEEEGYATYTCTVCGYSYRSNYVNVLKHDYNQIFWSYDSVGHYHTCTDEGYENLYTDFVTHTWFYSMQDEATIVASCTECAATKIIDKRTEALDLPIMMINTDRPDIVDKENYVNCQVSLINTENYDFEQIDAGIRVRGNLTSFQPKKPYRIKFDSKQNLFGFGKYKNWVLLASYLDFSNIKDYAAFQYAKSIDTEKTTFVPQAQHVEVYLNDQYIGLYLLTEQVQENKGRVGVELDFDETYTEIPFLVEWDEYAQNEGEEGKDWFRIFNTDSGVTSYYSIKYPEADQRYNQEQFLYVKNYIETVNTLCHDAEVTMEQFEEYVDLSAFIDYYLIQEFMGQGEINWKSIYMSRAIDGKLVMGPVWDFDWAVCGPIGSTWGYEGWRSSTNWFTYMLKKDWFFEKACARWMEIKDILSIETEKLKLFKSTIQAAAERNAVLWDFIDDDDPIHDFDGYYDYVMEFFENRLNWIGTQLTLN